MNGRSVESLSKSTGADYKKMMSNGSIDSMDKSVLSSETSYGDYDTNPNPTRYNEYSAQPTKRYSPPTAQKPVTKYGVPPTPPIDAINSFELSYRNDGFKDTSTIYTNTTRNNSVSTNINEDTPIIHQVDNDNDEYGSDYYGNASTLPIRAKGENLSFLTELKHRLPEYEAPRINSGHSSFLTPQSPDPPSNISNSSTLPYDQKVDTFTFTPPKPRERNGVTNVRRPDAYIAPPPDIRRPDSYMKAIKPRESIIPKSEYGRPKTLYESSNEPERPPVPSPPQPYHRSKSEALLETNFDDDEPPINLLTADNRSHSQPLETEF